MKRTAMMIAATVLACTVGATGVWAAGPGRNCLNQACTKAQCLFVDENGDGLCDNRTDGSCRYDTDGDGVCDLGGQGACYTDEDGDGLCDNRAAGGCQGGCHSGGHGYSARLRACQP